MVRVPLSPDEVRRGRELGALLRAARGDRTLLDVAGGAGISPETLRKIETGRIPTPSFTTVALLASQVGLSLDTIWHELGEVRIAGSLGDASRPERRPA
ncbi:MAG TPA: helix-turn-helix transcriptional regulator [Nakamurella sp.]